MNQPTYYLGIDPGKGGASGIVDANGGLVRVWDTPIIGKHFDVHDMVGKLRSELSAALWDSRKGTELVETLHATPTDTWRTHCALEQVGPHPKDGKKQAWNFGMGYGMWQGILAALGIPFELVLPRTWQKLVPNRTGKNPQEKKHSTVIAAKRRWPNIDIRLKKDWDRADGAWLAEYARRKEQGLL